MERDGRVWTDGCDELDAAFAVEVRDAYLAVVLRSAGGTSGGRGSPARNPDYALALEVLLNRIGELGAEVWDAQVDSLRTTTLPAEQRRLPIRLPFQPGRDGSALELRRTITRAETTVFRSPAASGYGNGRKQICLWLRGGSIGSDAPHLQRILSGELRVPEMVRQLSAVEREAEPPFDPDDDTDARRRVLRTIVARRGQQAFRTRLIDAYAGTCFLSGSRCVAVLEAAHVLPYGGEHTNHVANGLLLRADIHTLFDLGLLAIDTRQDPAWRVLLHRSLQGSAYATELVVGRPPSFCASAQHRSAFAQALDNHRRKSDLT